jgi:hypothetical protein
MLPGSAFARNRARQDGLQSLCRKCRKPTLAANYQQHREARIQGNLTSRRARADDCRAELWAYLLAHPCEMCGEGDPVVLEFHHANADKEQTVSHLARLGYLWQTIVKEIEKCAVLCANCHRRVTAHDRGYWKAGRW